MLSSSHRDVMQTKAVVIGRILMGLLFLYSGIGVLMAPGETAQFYSSVGIPLASIAVWVVIAIKIGAGGALILGKCTCKAAAALVLFTLAATIIAHADLQDPQLFKNLAIVGGLLYVIAFGPGTWSSAPSPAPAEPQETQM